MATKKLLIKINKKLLPSRQLLFWPVVVLPAISGTSFGIAGAVNYMDSGQRFYTSGIQAAVDLRCSPVRAIKSRFVRANGNDFVSLQLRVGENSSKFRKQQKSIDISAGHCVFNMVNNLIILEVTKIGDFLLSSYFNNLSIR